jgi:hypothetical protein
MPATFVVSAALGVELAGGDGPVLGPGDGAFLFKSNLRPAFLWQYGPRKPGHIEGKVMYPPQKNAGGYCSFFQHH